MTRRLATANRARVSPRAVQTRGPIRRPKARRVDNPVETFRTPSLTIMQHFGCSLWTCIRVQNVWGDNAYALWLPADSSTLIYHAEFGCSGSNGVQVSRDPEILGSAGSPPLVIGACLTPRNNILPICVTMPHFVVLGQTARV